MGEQVLRAQLAAAQRIPEDAALNALVADARAEMVFCDRNGWAGTSLTLEQLIDAITALRRRVATLTARLVADAELLGVYEGVLTEMRTYARVEGGIIAEWVERLDTERDRHAARKGAADAE